MNATPAAIHTQHEKIDNVFYDFNRKKSPKQPNEI